MQIVRLPALQENLKNKVLADPKTFEPERLGSALTIALNEVTTEMGFKN